MSINMIKEAYIVWYEFSIAHVTNIIGRHLYN